LDQRIQAAIEVIQNGISGKLEIADLARQTNVSASHLRHLFKTETGLSFTQYIKVIRMQQAELLLRGTTVLSVKKVVHRVGFSSESYFSREFRRIHGLAPGRYRAKAQLDGEVRDKWQVASQ
jgi:AraC family transcriptional regulator of arabinose operon